MARSRRSRGNPRMTKDEVIFKESRDAWNDMMGGDDRSRIINTFLMLLVAIILFYLVLRYGFNLV
ncbi:MAG: hypothetical protein ACQEP1_01030 [Nanobdellota archaeon]